jgi:uncharacterized protein
LPWVSGSAVLVADTSAIIASLNRADAAHLSVRAALEAERGRLVVVDYVIAEVDYLALKYLGRDAEEAFLDDVLAGGWSRKVALAGDIARVLELIRRFREHEIGIADAALLAVAERLNVRRILTLDRRHFSAFKFRDSKPLQLLPRPS